MGWKKIGKKSYYYKSSRKNGRVVSEYFGSGQVANLMAQIDELDRALNDQKRAEAKAERDSAEQEELEIQAWFSAIEILADGALLAAGYHKHKGQWRRERRGKEKGDREGNASNPSQDGVG